MVYIMVVIKGSEVNNMHPKFEIPTDPHFISAQGKREKILSLAVQSDVSVVWKFQFLNWCMYHCFSSFILVSTHSRYFHGV